MNIAKLKRARSLKSVIAELNVEHCNLFYGVACAPFENGYMWIKNHIETQYKKAIEGGRTVAHSLADAKRSVVSANGGSAEDWDSIGFK